MDAHDLLLKVPDAVDPEALEGLDVTVQYDVERPLAHIVADGRVTVIEGSVDEPDVVITAPDALLLDLYAGRANPTMAFMTGKLRIRGDVRVAQRLVAAIDRSRLPETG